MFIKFFKISIVFFTFLSLFAQNDITETKLKEHNLILSSEKFEGRKPGTKGIEYAEEYLAEQLKSYGLNAFNNNYFQGFEVVIGQEFTTNNHLIIDNIKYELKKDFSPIPLSANKSKSAKVVFVGYGFDIKTDNIEWNDYDNIDIKDKWVVILQGSPKDNDGKFSNFSISRRKALTAQEKGAAGVLFVKPVKNFYEDIIDDQLNSRQRASIDIPVLQITQKTANFLLENADASLDELIEFYEKDRVPFSFDIDKTVDASSEIKEIKKITNNVVGYIEGSDPILKNEYIVIGAHYDHLGWGGDNSGSRMPDTNAIHFGADDNASGVASILEIARKYINEVSEMKRSLIFVAFTAEEMGLIGSKYFVNNSPVDLDKISLMLNFDMVGRYDEEKGVFSVGGTGTAKGLEDHLVEVSNRENVKISMSKSGFGPSDHASFYTKNIPVLYFFTSLHSDYHTPFDTPDKVNYKGQKYITDFAYTIIKHFSNIPNKLEYVEFDTPTTNESARRTFKVSLGIMPDVAGSNDDGVGVDGVTPNKPAAKAGIKKGDKIIAIKDKTIKNVYEYMDQLNNLQAGEKVKVKLIRDKQTIEITVEL